MKEIHLFVKVNTSAQVTSSKLEQIKIDSLLRQVLTIQARIGTKKNSSRSTDINNEIALIKDFFEIDAIEGYGNIPSLRQTFMTWKRKGKDFQKVVLDILKGILKCLTMLG